MKTGMTTSAPGESITHQCLTGAENNTMTFPEIVGTLTDAGFDSYLVDMRLLRAVYYHSNGQCVEHPTHRSVTTVSPRFDVDALKNAIREAQTLAPGYTYKGFCDKAKTAGCAGYLVALSGRRAVYFGRSGETHTEHFPPSPSR